MALALVLVLFSCSAAHAGTTYSVEYKPRRGAYVAYDEEHQPVAELPYLGIGIDLSIAGNAKYLYYNMLFANGSGGTENVLYRYTIKTGKLKKLRKLPEGFETFSVMFLVGDTLFVTGRKDGQTSARSYAYSLPSKKLKKIADLAIYHAYGSKLVLYGSLAHLDGEKIVLYDHRTGKATKLCSHSDYAIQRGKYLYYSVISDADLTKIQDHKIIRLNLKTGKKKILADHLSCGPVKNITSAMVEYVSSPQTLDPNRYLVRFYFKDQAS